MYFLGGGTKISAQQACSKMVGIDSYLSDISDENSCQLTHLICFTVLTSELSLLSAWATNDVVQFNLRLNLIVQHLSIKLDNISKEHYFFVKNELETTNNEIIFMSQYRVFYMVYRS